MPRIPANRRMALHALAAIMALGARAALAAEYPSNPVNVVVPWAPAGIIDITARVIGAKMANELGQPVVVVNKPGAGGMLGADTAARARPDGYTLLLINSSLNMNAALGQKLPFDVSGAFEPVAVVARAPMILIAKPSPDLRSVKDLAELARARNGQLVYGTAGIGTPAHFAGEMFCKAANVRAVHVPYKGAAESITDQLAGRIDFQFANAAVAMPHIKAGKVIALATTGSTRLPLLPDVPTMAEAGYAGVLVDQWVGYLAPAGTPRPIVDRLSAAIGNALKDPGVREALQARGMVIDATSTPDGFRDLMKSDLVLWKKVVSETGIRIE